MESLCQNTTRLHHSKPTNTMVKHCVGSIMVRKSFFQSGEKNWSELLGRLEHKNLKQPVRHL